MSPVPGKHQALTEGSRTLDDWLEDLRLESPEVEKARARCAIRKMGTNALPELLKRLVYRDGLVKSIYYSRFGRQDIPHYVEIRVAADLGIEALGTVAAAAIPQIVGLLPANPELSFTLGAIGPDALPVLVAQLTNSNGTARAAAIAGLRRLGVSAEVTVPMVLNLVHDEDSRVRKSAIRMLGDCTPTRENLDALISGLADPDQWVRRDAAEAIGKYGENGADALRALIPTTNDPSPYTAEIARRAVERINASLTNRASAEPNN